MREPDRASEPKQLLPQEGLVRAIAHYCLITPYLTS